mmetsp:Transcript_17414/g.48347  ORF Transcript_17414/g.48347 Transcript_17414/m.48347 type:complete len:192 (+) Transcript_17414:1926-2501(+)|eukprot:CAMPEP_0202348716 /NCGR_PEP_ID=MMETSP1126-20121109/6517_1 /ASSEMBLY_ACC=CAM_ASM_000457 /TAXON_ID=3047 /ORGANISM="Dunaliella tertiolecta, Strain CCMP1320" /LENGTH=191 /DNA_ID=CAMNT_0048940423 /DNA_START=275 /DNA_END=850 /DNA_ORIENTATION=+
MKPELLFNFTSSNSIDHIKLKKKVQLFPVQFSASGKFNLHSKQLLTKFTCKDVVLRGKLSYDSEHRALEYRKRFPLPVPGPGRRLGCLVGMARWSFNEVSQCWDPAFRVGIEFGHGEMENFNSINFKPKLFIKNIGLEARTQACVHLPQRLAYDINEPQQAANGMQPQEFDDSNALRINFDLRELNLVLRL